VPTPAEGKRGRGRGRDRLQQGITPLLIQTIRARSEQATIQRGAQPGALKRDPERSEPPDAIAHLNERLNWRSLRVSFATSYRCSLALRRPIGSTQRTW
jgi:hypothetical protein